MEEDEPVTQHPFSAKSSPAPIVKLLIDSYYCPCYLKINLKIRRNSMNILVHNLLAWRVKP